LFKDPKLQEYLQYLSLGMEIAVGLCAPILLGYWIDTRWDTSPWFLLAGALTGIAIMIGTTVRIARKPENKK
jgi:F0F1-type ATP synthase assembly protein I